MTRVRWTAATLLAAASALAPATAGAAPAHKGTLSASSPKYEWNGGPLVGAVLLVEDDDTLLTVETGGTLTITTKDTSPDDPLADVDLYLYKSNAAGEPQGDAIADSLNGGSAEKLAKDVEPGLYLARVETFTGTAATYSATATLEGAAAPAAPGAGAPTPTPVATTTDAAPSAKLNAPGSKAKAKSLKVLKGTAKDDKGVARVDVAVVQVKGKKCSQLTAAGSFKKIASGCTPTTLLKATGTTAWSYKLKKPLPKGTYAIYAIATDTSGQKTVAKMGVKVS